jgi:hypothetical protein
MSRSLFLILSTIGIQGCEEVEDEKTDTGNSTTGCNDEDYKTEEVCNACDLTFDWSGLSATDNYGAVVNPDEILSVNVVVLSMSADDVYQAICKDDGSIAEDIQDILQYSSYSENSVVIPVSVDSSDSSLLITISGNSFTQTVYVTPSDSSEVATLNL